MPASRRTASCTSACPAPPSKTSRSVGTHTHTNAQMSPLSAAFLKKRNCCFCVWQVQIRPWNLNDSDFVMDGSQPLDPRKTIFVGGVPRPLRAGILHVYVGLFFFSSTSWIDNKRVFTIKTFEEYSAQTVCFSSVCQRLFKSSVLFCSSLCLIVLFIKEQ